MKIAYLGQMADISRENGISKKIREQSVAWMRHGHEVRYFALTPTTKVWDGLAPVSVRVRARGSAGRRLLQSLRLARDVQNWQPHAIYFRYAYHSAGLRSLFRRIPAIAELNSDDLTEYPLTLAWPKVFYHRLTRARILNAVAGFVAVTHEIATRFAVFAKPTEVIGNAIDLDSFPPAPAPRQDAPLRLVFVGSAGTPWHGLERVIELAGLLPRIEFDVVGCDAPNGTVPANLRFHGPLPRERYEPLLRAATAAIGTMALFRKRMDEACPLKVREYFACGLPVIAAYRDTDVPDGADYFLRLPNDARPLAAELERIESWLERWRGRRINRLAVAHLDTRIKEQQRLDFIDRVAGRVRA